MNLRFNHLKLHNFGSYADAELSLDSRGFCLVAGENHFVLDHALSNGAGKSTIWSAICYALTGETIQGLTTNLKNINIEEDECSVELNFSVDTDNYIITRYHRPKNDLKVIKNSIDISGKGIRESEKILAENIPDLTKDLISSTIIIGQGMPNKFSSFSPSGRKELLEKLTKSDFMIEDIKGRLLSRQGELTQLIRQYADSILVNNTTINNTLNTKTEVETELSDLEKKDFNTLISTSQTTISTLETELNKLDSESKKLEQLIENLTTQRVQLLTDKTTSYTELNTSYNTSIAENQQIKYQLEADIKTLQKEIKTLQAITDVCPTCGQKLPNVHKPDTTEKETALAKYQTQLTEVTNTLLEAKQKYDNYAAEIETNFNANFSAIETNLTKNKQVHAQLKTDIANITTKLTAEKEELLKLTIAKNNLDNKVKKLTDQKASIEEQLRELSNAVAITEAAKNEADEHLAVVKKMDTLVKRDFRGYLLADIIQYIDNKAKEYCQQVFNNTNLAVYLDGNTLAISYDNKLFDNLSGGEKQKCDLILQFAIRDLLQTYLNYSSNILVLDEIFDGLDKISTEKIIDLITNKLRDVESIFIISHHADELNLPIDSTITVIKNSAGISEIQ